MAFRFKVKGLNQLIRRAHDGFDPARDRYVDAAAQEFLDRAEEAAPVGQRPNPDRLKYNHRIDRRGSGKRMSLLIGNNKPYFEMVITGTRPHVILPRRAKALSWPGAAHPVRRVNHPGTRPNNYLDRAVEKAQGALTGRLFDRYVDDARAVWDADFGGGD